MKRKAILGIALIFLLTACPPPNDNNRDDIDVDPGIGTKIVFDNSEGTSTAIVYRTLPRNESNKMAEIPAGQISGEYDWISGSSTFFFSYNINIKGISAFTLNYIPEFGRDQNQYRIDGNKEINSIPIPKLASTVSSPDNFLVENSYILIQNNSSFSVNLVRGMTIILPDNLSDAGVNPGERAQYSINNNREVSSYMLAENARMTQFPASLTRFEPGRLYNFVYNGSSLSLLSTVEIKLENIANFTQNIPAAGTPHVFAYDGMLTVNWQPVQGAEHYEVYLNTSYEPSAFPARTLTGTIVVLDGLENKTDYYVWIKAHNSTGFSGFSPYGRGTPWSPNDAPGAPGRPRVTSGITQVTVDWDECAGASSYEVYCSATPVAPNTPVSTTFTMNGGTISGNRATNDGDGGGVRSSGIFNMTGGTISGNTAGLRGGGVFATGNFSKTGGIIYGSNGGDNSNTASNTTNPGHAISIGSGTKIRNSTAGENVNLIYISSTNWSGPWDN